MIPRRTKILATLGPATDPPQAFDKLVEAGVDVVRVNFSHQDADAQRRRVRQVREHPLAAARHVGVLADLQGPKIRVQRFASGPVTLSEGGSFTLDSTRGADAGDVTGVGVTYKELPNDVAVGDTLLLDDGRIVIEVEQVSGTAIRTRVRIGGVLSNNKGINRLGGGLSTGALTVKDRQDIRLAAEMQVDYLAVSFPRGADDIHEARELLRAADGHALIVAKIERAEAVAAIDEIIEAADAIMVARGDLGVEIGDAELPAVQKRLIQLARSRDRIVITATQMMESMIENPIPTRAEVFDVANAVLDGTDAVMLSAETAVGRYPHLACAAMDRVCRSAEKHRLAKHSRFRADDHFERVDEAIAMSAMYAANQTGVRAIAAMTESGSTALWMSRISSGIPIYALTPHLRTRRKVTLYRGVYPIAFAVQSTDHAAVNFAAIEELKRLGAIKDGDLIVITKGDLIGRHGGTNAMKIVRVGDEVKPEDL